MILEFIWRDNCDQSHKIFERKRMIGVGMVFLYQILKCIMS